MRINSNLRINKINNIGNYYPQTSKNKYENKEQIDNSLNNILNELNAENKKL